MNPETRKVKQRYVNAFLRAPVGERANVESAMKGGVQGYWKGQLGKAKKASAGATSWRGVASKIPSVMKDTVMGAIKGRLKKKK